MGYAVRRVPPDWSHPRDKHGKYIPLHGTPYEVALHHWNEGHYKNEPRPEPALGSCPSRGSYVTYLPSQATEYQVYEEVSEGTPLSPVLPTAQAVEEWLVSSGTCDVKNAEAFVKLGNVPTLSRVKNKFVNGIQAALSLLHGRGKRIVLRRRFRTVGCSSLIAKAACRALGCFAIEDISDGFRCEFDAGAVRFHVRYDASYEAILKPFRMQTGGMALEDASRVIACLRQSMEGT